MVSEIAPPNATALLSYITGKWNPPRHGRQDINPA